jgi:enoyl-CoA hydratase/carnithine racemase
MPAEIKSTHQDGTLVLTVSNPEHRNALGPEIYAAGIEALGVAESLPEVRSVVITGEGATFSAGGQLQRLLEIGRAHV